MGSAEFSSVLGLNAFGFPVYSGSTSLSFTDITSYILEIIWHSILDNGFLSKRIGHCASAESLSQPIQVFSNLGYSFYGLNPTFSPAHHDLTQHGQPNDRSWHMSSCSPVPVSGVW